MACPLSQGESAPTLVLTGFYWLNLHGNTGYIWKAHQSLSGSNNQIDNIQRMLSQGQIAKGAENFGETNSFHAWTLII